MRLILTSTALAAAAALAPITASAQAPACTHTVGMVVSLTGAAGRFGQAAAKSVELAFNEINKAAGAGGVAGCKLGFDLRDAQSQGSVAVDQARQLVDLKKVPAIIGGIISSVSIPIVTSVTGPAGVVQISPASTSPTLTKLGNEGKTGGWFFRTITSDALQGTAAAKYAIDQGLTDLAIVHVNNDFGVNMLAEFRRAYEALGGKIRSVTPYNPQQPSYAAEVTNALKADAPGAVFHRLPGRRHDHRAHLDPAGRAAEVPLQRRHERGRLHQGRRAAVPEQCVRHLVGTSKTPSTEFFAQAYPAMSGGFDAGAPAADRAFDAAAILGLAVAHAGKFEAAAIRDSIRKITEPGGEVVNAGPQGFARALQLIKDKKPVRYVGVIGAVQFDKNGDIVGPFRTWKLVNGEVTTVGQMSSEDVQAVQARLPK